MTMTADIIQVNPGSLLVRDISNNQEVLVLARNTGQFRVGDRVRILFSGQMTLSIPPQITAISIQRVERPQPAPSQLRGIVLQIGRGFLTVWDMRGNRVLRVQFPNSQLFRVGQQVVVRYDTITFDNPPRITAINVFPA